MIPAAAVAVFAVLCPVGGLVLGALIRLAQGKRVLP